MIKSSMRPMIPTTLKTPAARGLLSKKPLGVGVVEAVAPETNRVEVMGSAFAAAAVPERKGVEAGGGVGVEIEVTAGVVEDGRALLGEEEISEGALLEEVEDRALLADDEIMLDVDTGAEVEEVVELVDTAEDVVCAVAEVGARFPTAEATSPSPEVTPPTPPKMPPTKPPLLSAAGVVMGPVALGVVSSFSRRPSARPPRIPSLLTSLARANGAMT